VTGWELPRGHDRTARGIEADDGPWGDYLPQVWAPRPIRDRRPVPAYSWLTLGFVVAAILTGVAYAVLDVVRALR
jgi:hypothetical protein